jgi:hypothetical protein
MTINKAKKKRGFMNGYRTYDIDSEGTARGSFVHPNWTHVTRAEVEKLIGEEVKL